MPTLRLTALAVDRLRTPSKGQVEYFDTHLPAFGIRASYSGTKAWIVMTRVHGKLIRVTLGRYPELSLAAARKKAYEIALHAREGHDPRTIEAAHRQRSENERRTTFDVVASKFLDAHVKRNRRPKTCVEYRRALQGRDTLTWQSRPITTITKDDVKGLLNGIEQRGSPAAANRTLAYLSKFFNWCIEEDLIVTSPTARVRAPCMTTSRDRVLSYDELRWLWRALDSFSGPFAPLFKVLLLTGQRRGEVGGMRWDELRELGTDRATWELPPARTKNSRSHLVPLTSPV
jgi:integrase